VRPPSLLLKWNTYLPDNQAWITIYKTLLTYSHITASETALKDAQSSTNSFDKGIWVHNIIHRLLTIRPLLHGNKREDRIEEACRLASLIYMAPIRRSIEKFPVRTRQLVKKLRLAMLPIADWVQLWPIRIWCLYIGAIESRGTLDAEWFVMQLAADSWEYCIRGWIEIRQCVMQILWIESVFRGLDDHLLILNLETYRDKKLSSEANVQACVCSSKRDPINRGRGRL
jgi:hypothetical protein